MQLYHKNKLFDESIESFIVFFLSYGKLSRGGGAVGYSVRMRKVWCTNPSRDKPKS